MKISEIKDKELRELAELRREQYEEKKGFVGVASSDYLPNAFSWNTTRKHCEGYEFWSKVNNGEITTIPEGIKNK